MREAPAARPSAGAAVCARLASRSLVANRPVGKAMTGRMRTLGLGIAIAQACAAPAHSQEVWTGQVKQNSGATDYTAVMRLSGDGGETDYPELKCGGILT